MKRGSEWFPRSLEHAVVHIVDQRFHLEIDGALHHRCLNLLPLTCPLTMQQRGQDTHRQQRRAMLVHDGGAGRRRHLTGPSGCPGQTRHGLQQQILSRQVSIRAILAVSRRRGVNDPGVDALDVVVP